MNALSRARLGNAVLVLSAVLSVVATVLSFRVPSTSERAVRQRHLLPVFEQSQVSRIEIRDGQAFTVATRAVPSEGEAVAAENDGPALASDWRLVEPFEMDADEAPIDRLLGSLRYATWVRPAEGRTLAPVADAGSARGPHLGRQVLALRMGEREFRLVLGGESVSPSGSRYVAVSGTGLATQTYVIDERLVKQLFIDGHELRGRQIVPYGKGSTQRLVISSAAGVRRATRGRLGFRFDGMNDDRRVERRALDRVFTALARAVADPFLSTETARAALSVDATVRVALTPRDRTKRDASLEFGGTCPEAPDKIVAIRHLPEPVAGCVDRSVLPPLRESAESLEDTGLFFLRADEIDSLSAVAGDRELELARRGEGFIMRKPREAQLDADAARDRLERLATLSGELLTGSGKPRGGEKFDDVVVTLESSSVRLADVGEAERASEPTAAEPPRLGTAEPPLAREVVRLSSPRKDGSVWAYRESDSAVLAVDADSVVALWPDATLLKDTQVFDYPADQVRRIAIDAGSVDQVLLRTEEGGLSLTKPKGYDVDGGLAVQLVDQLRTLRAVRWVSDRYAKGFGLDKPSATVKLSVQVDGRDVERTLELGRRAPGGYYAKVDRDPGVLVVSRAVERVISTWLLTRGSFAIPAAGLIDLTVLVPGRGTLVAKRVAGELRVSSSSRGFDSEQLLELLDALSALQPERALHLGRPGRGEGFQRPLATIVARVRHPTRLRLSTQRLSIGARDSVDGSSIHYARDGSINATFALPSHQVRRLLDLF